MPELPEVEVVRAGLVPALAGARLEAVTVLDARSLTRHPGDAPDFEARLTGRRVDAVVRRGKFLWMPLADAGAEPAEAIVGHLGMSGQMLLREPGTPTLRHERIRFDVRHPTHGEIAMVFVDQRTFGSLAIDRLERSPLTGRRPVTRIDRYAWIVIAVVGIVALEGVLRGTIFRRLP